MSDDIQNKDLLPDEEPVTERDPIVPEEEPAVELEEVAQEEEPVTEQPDAEMEEKEEDWFSEESEEESEEVDLFQDEPEEDETEEDPFAAESSDNEEESAETEEESVPEEEEEVPVKKPLPKWLLAVCFVLVFLLGMGVSYLLVTSGIIGPEEPEPMPTLVPIITPSPTPTATPTPTPTATPSPTPEPTMIPEMVALREQNNDFVFWIKIDDTPVDYPVMYAPHKYDATKGSKAEYYLYRDFNEDYLYEGSIFLDSHNAASDRNLYLWGHNMKDGSMFRTLHYYGDKLTSVEKAETFYKEHPYITIGTFYGELQYEIIAAFHADIGKDLEYMYWFHPCNTEEEFNQYVTYIKENSFYDTGKTAEWGDHLLSLSVCWADSNVTSDKMVVVARQVGAAE